MMTTSLLAKESTYLSLNIKRTIKWFVFEYKFPGLQAPDCINLESNRFNFGDYAGELFRDIEFSNPSTSIKEMILSNMPDLYSKTETKTIKSRTNNEHWFQIPFGGLI